MALNTELLKTNLTNKIKKALDAPISEKSDSDKIKQTFAESIAEAIATEVEAWIKTATVTVKPGIQVATTGTSAAQKGVTTSSGTGIIS